MTLLPLKRSILPDLYDSGDRDSRYLNPSYLLTKYESERTESLHFCFARIKQLTFKPVIVDISPKPLQPTLKAASVPSNLDRTFDEEDNVDSNKDYHLASADNNVSFLSSDITTDLKRRLNLRKDLIHSAKLKFLGFKKGGDEVKTPEKVPNSPICALISEIRETINEIMSPERSVQLEEAKDSNPYFSTLKWRKRPKFVPVSKAAETCINSLENVSNDCLESKTGRSCFKPIGIESLNDFKKDFHMLPKSDDEESKDTSSLSCTTPNAFKMSEDMDKIIKRYNREETVANILTEIIKKVSVSEEEQTDSQTEDSLLPTYSFTDTTETEWYYDKTIMNMENSQTVLEVKDSENKEIELGDGGTFKCTDTGIDTDFTSERENEVKSSNSSKEEKKEMELLNTTAEIETEIPLCESSTLNKSSETDSSFLKSSSGRTSNDVDTSLAFKTETENSEKTHETAADKSEIMNCAPERKDLFIKNVIVEQEKILYEVKDDREKGTIEIMDNPVTLESCIPKLPDIPESPEFTNIDTEDAPITSSSKGTSPENVNLGPLTEEDQVINFIDGEHDSGKEEVIVMDKPTKKKKRKKNSTSSTLIKVKKKVKENDSAEPVLSKIKLTIKNSKQCQTEKYEVKIQDVADTSEEFSSSVGEEMESFETLRVINNTCECDAKQNLEELQDEVTYTIEKLQKIENYFEDEIKKHSGDDKNKTGSDEGTIECYYREFEDVLNESKGITVSNEKKLITSSDVDLLFPIHSYFAKKIETLEENTKEAANLSSSSHLSFEWNTQPNKIEKFLTGESLKLCVVEPLPREIKEKNYSFLCENSAIIDYKNQMNPEVEETIDEVETVSSVTKDSSIEIETMTESEFEIKSNKLINNNNSFSPYRLDVLKGKQIFDNTNPRYCRISVVDESNSEETLRYSGSYNIDVMKICERQLNMNKKKKLCSDTLMFTFQSGEMKPLLKKLVNSYSIHSKILKKKNFLGFVSDIPFYFKVESESLLTEALKNASFVEGTQNFLLKRESLFGGMDESYNTSPVAKYKLKKTAEKDENKKETISVLSSHFESDNETEIFINEKRENSDQDIQETANSIDCKNKDGKDILKLRQELWDATSFGCEGNVISDKLGKLSRELDEIDGSGKNVFNERVHSEGEYVQDKLELPLFTCWDSLQHFELSKYLESVLKRLSSPLMSISWHSKSSSGQLNEGNHVTPTVTRNEPSVNDVINFIINNEESPADSLIEFEDLENLVSSSLVDLPYSVVSQMDEDIESLPEENVADEEIKEEDDLQKKSGKQSKAGIFKVTISTPTKKEIFINYSRTSTSTFNLSCEDFDLCNSYINTDDVNEDFENLSSENSNFFSIVSSPNKTCTNLYDSVISDLEVHSSEDQYSFQNSETGKSCKSPTSLSIIQEVDEGEFSSSSEMTSANTQCEKQKIFQDFL